jgi:predicted deacetylase
VVIAELREGGHQVVVHGHMQVDSRPSRQDKQEQER